MIRREKASILLAVLIACTAASASADEPRARAAALEPSDPESVLLRYRFSAGEEVRIQVTHLVSVETKIRDVAETNKTRAVSTKVWRVERVDEAGNARFSHTVEDVNMWQQSSGKPEVRYDSRTDKEPPPEYAQVAGTVGVPLATVTVAADGRILERKSARPQFQSTIGELTPRLPETPVKVGQQWSEEEEVPIHLPDKPVKRIKTRRLYTLESVKTGIATISVKTQVLTPVDDPAIQSQLVQRVKRGEIRFDVDAGRMLSQQMDVDETVIGFNGPDSMMKYLARLSEEALPDQSVAAGSPRTVQ